MQSQFAPHTSDTSGEELKHTRIHLDTRAVAHSEYSEAKQLDARVPVDTK